MTFSIVGRCQKTGELGVAVASSLIAIGNRSPQVRSGVGAVSIQNAPSPVLAGEVLDLLQSGLGPTSALNLATEEREYIDQRQILIVNREGRTGHFTGEQVQGHYATCEGRDAVAGMCGASSAMVPSAMIVAFEQRTDAPLAARLINALEAGAGQNREQQGVHSAVLLVARDQKWPYIDLRVDWHQSAPIEVLRGLWDAYRVEVETNLVLALRPGAG